MTSKIVFTKTDEAPALATYSLLPIVQAFGAKADLDFDLVDISLAGRIIANFPEKLSPEQQISDALADLGELAKSPEANIIKLPNISASIPQLKAAIAELQDHGYDLPDYPEDPKSDEEKAIVERYAKVLGSAVNPVLREGNSDRRVAAAVKAYAQKHPHRMGAWSSDSKSHVSHMSEGDFFSSERSHVMASDAAVSIELTTGAGEKQLLKSELNLLEGEVIDASVISRRALRSFLADEVADAKAKDVLFSVHLKATMMKVSDPILFGHAVSVYFADVFEKYADSFAALGVNPNNGLGDLYKKIATLSDEQRTAIEADLAAALASGPDMAMVDSDKGITNLHVPSDVIIDASMPAAIRASGQMWGPDGQQKDTKFIIPDRCYAGIYKATVDFCAKNGAFDPKTMGNVANVGLMAKKAEEYGSHDKTFEITAAGTVRVVAADGATLLEHEVEQGDIWRMCQTKDVSIRDWVKLGVSRARATGNPAIFWLNAERAHDAKLIEKVNVYLKDHDTEGLDIRILPPIEACEESLQRCKDGLDTISVTGNVLRDYLTDLFPILELGTSAKMLSIVPLLAGGGLFETGAGGSAPKHVQQFVAENHLRWDSLGEFLALAVSIEDLAQKSGNKKAAVLAKTLHQANGLFLDNDKSPSRKVGELDNRGSHFYLSLYWAQSLAAQDEDADLKAIFSPIADNLSYNEGKIVKELNDAQGRTVALGGYFQPNDVKASEAMRPSETFNGIVESLKA
jgi:isocitrate dehydrogenase